MKFSILLSLYHKEQPAFLDLAIKSIWTEQTVKPYEIILVLDGPISGDLQEIVSKWENIIGTPLKIIKLLKNVGLGKALNEGLLHCSSEWVFRMDTDDICLPDRFEKQINFIQKNPNIILFGGQILEFGTKILDAHVIKAVPTNHTDIIKFAQKRNPFNHMTVAYKKDIILALGGYHHHLFMEDYNLWLRIISKGYQVANLSDIILYARVGNGMHARRRGLGYIKSEKQLLDLKLSLKLQSVTSAYIIFILRSLFRFMPSNILGFAYNYLLRKKAK